MKKLLLAATTAMMMTSTCAWAEFKAAVVDVPRIMAEIPQKDQISDRLNKEFADRIEAVNRIETEMKALQDKMQKDGAFMSAAQQSDAMRQLQLLNARGEIESKALQEDMNRRQKEEQQALLGKVKTAIDTVAKTKNYDIVMQGGSVVFAKPEHDISADVISELSKAK